jgi:hypothetical protein
MALVSICNPVQLIPQSSCTKSLSALWTNVLASHTWLIKITLHSIWSPKTLNLLKMLQALVSDYLGITANGEVSDLWLMY